MEKNRPYRIAVLGNPNCGKTSIFNLLTGLQQKVGNFPGVTVERKSGPLTGLPPGHGIELIDFPGTYSFYPNSADERLVVQTLVNPGDPDYPDAVLYVADATRLETHLLLFTQIKDAGFPMVLALNMSDVAAAQGLVIDSERLSRKLDTPVLPVSGRSGEGIAALRNALLALETRHADHVAMETAFYRLSPEETRVARELLQVLPGLSLYQRLLCAHHVEWLPGLPTDVREKITGIALRNGFSDIALQISETMHRYDVFSHIVEAAVQKVEEKPSALTEKLDNLLTHRIAGPLIFFGLMLLLFQSIFTWAAYPMDGIESAIAFAGEWIRSAMAPGWFPDLLVDGLLAGLGGVLVFIPQIALLFFFVGLLDEVGYMARAAFMFDRIMQAFGMNGRSVVALISGGACAIPAIMSARTISNWKERLLTILVTPFISCSARIPVYTVLIAFAVPPKRVLGIFQLQGLAFMALYLLGIAAALLAAFVLKYVLKSGDGSFLMLELPPYRPPLMRNVWMAVWEKVRSFTLEAGKIILLISMVLWALSSYGPPRAMQAAGEKAVQIAEAQQLPEAEAAALSASLKIEASYAGHVGRLIEPAIRPLGFDWKIGIALITSFAAREVFVGAMATIYSVSDADDTLRVQERMARERNPLTGKLVYDPPTAWALLLFYVFAMQCMSTMAVVRRETLSWKWPFIQFLFMTGLAYLSAWLVQVAF